MPWCRRTVSLDEGSDQRSMNNTGPHLPVQSHPAIASSPIPLTASAPSPVPYSAPSQAPSSAASPAPSLGAIGSIPNNTHQRNLRQSSNSPSSDTCEVSRASTKHPEYKLHKCRLSKTDTRKTPQMMLRVRKKKTCATNTYLASLVQPNFLSVVGAARLRKRVGP